MIRLLTRRNWGIWRIVMEVSEADKPKAEEWALRGFALDPNTQWKFEETSGKLIRDRLYEFFNRFVRKA